MIVSIITPAYRATDTIGATLSSIFAAALPDGWALDPIVVDDGSPDGDALARIVGAYDGIRLLRSDVNQGKNAALGLGIPQSLGDIAIILDADDTLVADWPERLRTILDTWPEGAPLCFSACRTADGATTVADPDYTGPLSFRDMLHERHMGEYLPIFRGAALRDGLAYNNPAVRSGCELWTYLSYAKGADLWVSAETLRIYDAGRPGSLSVGLFSPLSAQALAQCYEQVFKDFGQDWRTHCPRNLARRRLRQAVFYAIAGERGKALRTWRDGARFDAPLETLGALLLIPLGAPGISFLVQLAKRAGLIRRYG